MLFLALTLREAQISSISSSRLPKRSWNAQRRTAIKSASSAGSRCCIWCRRMFLGCQWRYAQRSTGRWPVVSSALARSPTGTSTTPSSRIRRSRFSSFPRSGNTVAMGTVARLLGGQIFEALPGSLFPFSKQIYPRTYPYTRLVKDHVARPIYLHDKAVILIRDGRDAMISLAYMTFKQTRHAFCERANWPISSAGSTRNYEFGGWADHMRAVGALMRGPGKLLVRYDDFAAGPDVLRRIVDFVDPDHGLSAERIQETFDRKSNIFEGLGANPHSRDQWGIGASFLRIACSMNGRETDRARTGGRPGTLRPGKRSMKRVQPNFCSSTDFETDPDWWKRDTSCGASVRSVKSPRM